MDFAAARRNMVENQIRPNRVTDHGVILAMSDLPREPFVPKPLRGNAYIDEAIDLGGGRHMMEPMVLALLLQAARVEPTDAVMVIGCGCGYAVAVMARLASTVVALECDPGLSKRANETLAGMGVDTVTVVEGELAEGCPDQGPFDVILFNGAVSEIPPAVGDQLAEGGRMVAVIEDGAVGTGVVVDRLGGVLYRRHLFDAGTPLLPGFEKKPAFVF